MSKLAMYVFIDALGWEIYQKYGFLNDIAPNSRRLTTTFGFSSAADPSILTGRYPDEHGHWSSFIYDPQNSPFKWMRYLAMLPSAIFDRWRVRHVLSKIIKHLNSYTGYFELYSVPFKYLPYYDYLEKKDYFVPGGIIKTDTIFDWCVYNNIDYYCSNWRDTEEEILNANKLVIAEGKVKFVYVYLPKLDSIMHNHGPFSQATEAKLRSLEDKITALYQFAQTKYSEVALYAISDHGMAPVIGSYDLMTDINALGYRYGEDYLSFYDSTMARFWFSDQQAKNAILALLAKLECGRIVPKSEMQQMRVSFSHKLFGEEFFLMNEGMLINPSFMGLRVIPGMHGYHPADKHSHSIMVSNQNIPEDINSITDIRKTMEAELAQR